MSIDPVEYYGTRYPELVARGLDLLAGSSAADERAWVESVRGVRATALLQFVGSGEVALELSEGVLRRVDELGPGPKNLALEVDAAHAAVMLELLGAPLDVDDASARRAARMSLPRMIQLFAGQELAFHLTILEVPELGEVVLKVGVNLPSAPTTPRFQVALKLGDLEDVRDGRTTARALLSGGRVRFRGDYARAMSLALKAAS